MTEKKSVLSDPLVQFVLGLSIMGIAGVITNIIYESKTPEQKKEWDQDRIMHHGELGAIATTAGIAAKSPFVTGAGVGLMLTDLQDAEQWFTKKKTA